MSLGKSNRLTLNRKLKEERDYWAERLSSAPASLHLRPDYPMRPDDDAAGRESFRFTFPPSLAQELAKVTGDSPLLLYATLLTALKICLQRYTDNPRVVVGSPPRRKDGEPPPQPNALAIVDQFESSHTFRQLLLQVRETLLAAYARQTYPYEQIVSYLAPGRKDLSLLLDVVLALDGLHGELSPVESNVTIFVGREGRELSATVEFNSRLYDRETVSRLTGHWVTLLESGLANVDAPLGRLEMLTRAERTRLLVEWGGGADGPVEECLTEMFERQARERPGAVALAFEQGELTYAELDARANQLARHLRSLGVGPERLVALCLDRTPELVVALLGVLKAGGAYLPLDPASPPQRLAFMLADAAAMLVLTDSAHEQALADGKAPVLRLDAEAALIARQESGPLLPIGLLPAHAAYVIYTSGSTGQPKGVVVTHGNVSRLLRVTQPQFGFDHRDVWTLFHSYAFDVSVWEMWGALAHGGTLVVVPYWVSRSPESFLRLLRERRVTVLDQTPSAFQQLVRAEAEQAGEGELALRVVIFAGEALDAAALAPWIERHGDERPQLINMYGITETTVHSTYHRVRACEASDPLRRSLIGRGLGDLRLYILDAELNPAPVGVRGEIYVGGAGVSRGYLGRSGLTAERFVPDALGDEPGARLYRSGDLGRWNGEGVIEYEGRIDEQVKIRGYRIELGEITALLSQHDAVREALVTVSSGEGDKRLNAYVVPEQGRALDVGELKSYLKERLPDYMTPTSFTVLDAFPLTINGKIDRRALPAPGQERRHLGSAFVAPGTQTEELLARIWVQVLGVEQVGVNDNFFELGGHSLLATQVMLRVRETFGVEPPLRELFDSPTVAGLGRSVDARKRAEAQGPPLVAVSRDEDLPLSYAQHRLWFLDQLQPGSPLYNISLALRLRGDLHVEALRATFAAIVRRHESLRTVFTQRNGVPSQRILPAEAAEELTSFSVTDLCDLGDAERQDAARRLAGEEAARPFDLGAGPLLRISLLRLGAAEHVLTVTMHHIVSDGWSVGVLVREVASLYSAFVAGRPSPLPELEIQYADFAAWQRRWLTGDTLESQLAYWRAQLDGAAGEVLSLPTDRPRPAVQTGNGARVSFTLDPELGRKLAAFAHGEDATLFMAVLAAFQSLLYRYTGQERVSVGAPIANRVRRETEGLIGLFMNTLVMRADLSSDPCFRDLLRQVREVCLGAYAHQDLPFERLVEELQVERDVSRSPLFQVMCVLHNTPQVALELPGLELRDEPRDAVTAKFDLTLSLVEDAGALSGFFEYNTDLFEEATIRRMLGHFGVLLEGALADPDRRISALPMLGEDERARLLSGLNDTARDYPRARLLHHDFEARAASDPDAVALLFEGERVTYGELDARAGRVARRLRALGVGAEALVGVCLERSPGMLAGLLGILKAGGAYLPLDPSYPPERLAFMLSDSGVGVVLTQRRLEGRLRGYAGRLLFLDDPQEVVEETEGVPGTGGAGAATAENLAYVIYTSGSTGRPKGVMVSHGNVSNFFAAMDEAVGGEGPGTWLALTSLSFDISVLELLWTLARGFRVVLHGEEYRSAPVAAAPDADAAADMAFSLSYFASDDQAADDGYRLLLEGAKFADRHGFTAVWTPERHFHAFGGLFPNPSVISAAIAAVTERVSIRAGSVVMPLHNPIRVAEEWAVVDRLSKGRVAVSFASGWHADDFALAPGNFANRKEVLLRDLEIVRRLWRGEAISTRSGTGKDVPVKIHPRPVQAELPVWITAAGNPETFRIAGELGANVLTHLVGQSIEELREKIVLYRDTWNASGHPVGGGHVTLMLHTFVGAESGEVKETVRGPLCEYLKSSLDLRRSLVQNSGGDPNPGHLSEADLDALLAQAFERYFETSGLFGTPEDCVEMVDRLRRMGVNEIACLIDFGVPTDKVLDSLPYLKLVSERGRANGAGDAGGYTVASQIAAHGVTHLQCTPSMARLLAADDDSLRAARSLRTLLLGGEALPAPLAALFLEDSSAQLFNMYGPTETTIWSASHRVESAAGHIPLGRPVANTALYVLDGRGEPAPVGVPGELYIGGEGVTRGYLGRAALTAERFVPDPFGAAAGARLYRTGDRVRWDARGELEFLGRMDQQVKLRGFRIELGEVEAVIRQHPLVRDAAVVVHGDGDDRRLAAYVAPAPPPDAAHTPPAFDPKRLNGGHQYVELPNGMSVSHVSAVHAHGVYREIFEENVYLRHGVTLADGDCVFDIGANIGMFSLFVGRMRRDVTIHAFEPIPPTFEVLRNNVELYGLKAQLYECGLAERDGEASFTFYPELPGLSGRYSSPEKSIEAARSMIAGHEGVPLYLKEAMGKGELEEVLGERFRSETFTCRLRTLSGVIGEKKIERIDLLKLDVEKSELDVLNGIREEDWGKIRQIVAEVEGKAVLEQITGLLGRHGYDYVVEELLAIPGDDGREVEVYMLYAVRRGLRRAEAGDSLASAAAPPPRAAGGALTVRELKSYLKERLPDYMLPSVFTFLPELPLTPNGKLDRRRLPAPAHGESEPEAKASYVAPQTEMEKLLASVWQKVLRVEKVGVHENFFELGGNSLLAVQVHSDLRERLKRDIAIIHLFRHPTLEGLARYLSEAEPAEDTDFDGIRQQAERQRRAINRQRQEAKLRRVN